MAYDGTGGRRRPYPSKMESRHDLRGRLRAERRSLAAGRRRRAEAAIVARIRRLSRYVRASTVAAYLPFDGEPDLSALFDADPDKRFFLPVIGHPPDGSMRFAAFQTGDRLQRNRFGIHQPIAGPTTYINPKSIDVVLAPMVGFDDSGRRLGMGGGYYDRCFEFMRDSTRVRPDLVGIAFECQRVADVGAAEWDVPMSVVITEKHAYLP